jgi:hypothetical protein
MWKVRIASTDLDGKKLTLATTSKNGRHDDTGLLSSPSTLFCIPHPYHISCGTLHNLQPLQMSNTCRSRLLQPVRRVVFGLLESSL